MLIGTCVAMLLAVGLGFLLVGRNGPALKSDEAQIHTPNGTVRLEPDAVRSYVRRRAAEALRLTPAQCVQSRRCRTVASQHELLFKEELLWSVWIRSALAQRGIRAPTRPETDASEQQSSTGASERDQSALSPEEIERQMLIIAWNEMGEEEVARRTRQPTGAAVDAAFARSRERYQHPASRMAHVYRASNEAEAQAFRRALQLTGSFPAAVSFVKPGITQRQPDPGAVMITHDQDGEEHPLYAQIFAAPIRPSEVHGPVTSNGGIWFFTVERELPARSVSSARARAAIHSDLYNRQLEIERSRWRDQQLSRWRQLTRCGDGWPEEMCAAG